ncbi:DUF6891 domain-containing protein [Herbidospora sp. RD11066]
MPAIIVTTQNGQRHLRPTETDLADLVRRLGDASDQWLVVQRVPDLPAVFIQVAHATGETYTLEYRDGTPGLRFEASLDAPDQVIAAMIGWARADDGWNDGITWSRVEFATDPVPPLDLDDEKRNRLEERVREWLVCGYVTRQELAERTEEYFVSGGRKLVSADQARQLADRLWVERVQEQAAWSGETDPDRISRAFEELDTSGITAREDFTCCRTCGNSEIGDEGGPGARGFVYFHSQGTEAAADGHGLSLMYGGFDGSPETTAAVGREVVKVLEEAGLPVVWNGDPGQAITITPLDWRKRLIG